jgi:hypothetical protein
MRALKGRQAALLAIQRDAEEKLAEARNWGNQGTVSVSFIIHYLKQSRKSIMMSNISAFSKGTWTSY